MTEDERNLIIAFAIYNHAHNEALDAFEVFLRLRNAAERAGMDVSAYPL